MTGSDFDDGFVHTPVITECKESHKIFAHKGLFRITRFGILIGFSLLILCFLARVGSGSELAKYGFEPLTK